MKVQTPTPPTATAEIAPPLQLMRMGLGYQVTQLVAATARMGLADLLREGPKSSGELAAATGAHGGSMFRFLRACGSVGLLDQVGDDAFAVNPVSVCLQTHVQSLHGFALGMGEAGHIRPFEKLYEAVMTGRSVVKEALGMDMWEYYDKNPSAKASLTEHLDEVAVAVAPQVVANFDVSRFTRIVDVGANQGFLLSAMLKAAPNATGVLFDRPEIVADARAAMEARGLAGRVEIVGGDFRDEVPADGDLYLLKGILHDWDDAPAAKILRNCHRAARPGSSLLSLEGIVPSTPPLDPLVHLIDLSMLVLVGGRERTREEFDELFESSGYRIERTVPLKLGYFPYHIIEARRI